MCLNQTINEINVLPHFHFQKIRAFLQCSDDVVFVEFQLLVATISTRRAKQSKLSDQLNKWYTRANTTLYFKYKFEGDDRVAFGMKSFENFSERSFAYFFAELIVMTMCPKSKSIVRHHKRIWVRYFVDGAQRRVSSPHVAVHVENPVHTRIVGPIMTSFGVGLSSKTDERRRRAFGGFEST